MNKQIIYGRITRDPEISIVGANKTTLAKFSVAVQRKRDRNEADFFNVIAWGKLAELVDKYWHKGDPILVIGRTENGFFTNKEGQRVNTSSLVAEELYFSIDKKRPESNSSEVNVNNGNSDFVSIPDGVGEEIPFL